MWQRWFQEHPSAVGESYIEHFGVATGFGVALIRAGFACLLHALFPALCTTTGSREIARLHGLLVVSRHRRRQSDVGDESLNYVI